LKGVPESSCGSLLGESPPPLRGTPLFGVDVRFGRGMTTVVVVRRQVVRTAGMVSAVVDVKKVVCAAVTKLGASLVARCSAGVGRLLPSPSLLPMSRAKLWDCAATLAVRTMV